VGAGHVDEHRPVVVDGAAEDGRGEGLVGLGEPDDEGLLDGGPGRDEGQAEGAEPEPFVDRGECLRLVVESGE
jgi:hypothetical protein